MSSARKRSREVCRRSRQEASGHEAHSVASVSGRPSWPSAGRGSGEGGQVLEAKILSAAGHLGMERRRQGFQLAHGQGPTAEQSGPDVGGLLIPELELIDPARSLGELFEKRVALSEDACVLVQGRGVARVGLR